MSLRSPVLISLRLLLATLLFGSMALVAHWDGARIAFGILLVVALVFEVVFWRSILKRRKRAVIDTRPPSERHQPLD